MHRLFLNVGYDLSEQQLRPYFAKFGTIKDLYLPKNVSGRNKGYGFLTYSTKSALSSVAQQPRHVVDGKVVQVKLAGPRPVRESKPLTTTCTDLYRDFGRGHRLYVGGVSEAVTQEQVRHHFTKWGDVLDVYFPVARGLSRSKYCFVTFGNNESAQQACRESERSIDGWPLKSINVAEDRKDDGHQASPLAGKVRSSGLLATPASATLHMPCAADPASLPGYVSWLELQHQHAVRQLDRLDKLQVSVDLWLKLYPILSLERVAHTFNLSFETTCTAHNYAHLNRAFNQLQHHVNTSTQRVGSSPDVDFA